MISIQIGDAGIGLGLAWACPLLSEVRANFRNKLGDEKGWKSARKHPQSQGIYKLIVLQGPYLNLAGQSSLSIPILDAKGF